MRADAIARRYARAIFELAHQDGTIDAVASALRAAAELLDDPEAARVLTGPMARARKGVWLSQLAEEAGAPRVLGDFLRLLAARDRLDHLGAIHAVFTALVDRQHGVTRATVRSASALADDVRAEIGRVFGEITGKTVLVDGLVDTELIAGIIVEVDGRVYDGSLRTQLAKLHRQMATDS
jgi:F-type H+-transporting ATPase subunit delta